MTYAVMLLIGGVMGWIGSVLLGTRAQEEIFLNVVIGIAGALFAGLLIMPLIGGTPVSERSFDLLVLLSSTLGAMVLLAVVNLIRHGSIR